MFSTIILMHQKIIEIPPYMFSGYPFISSTITDIHASGHEDIEKLKEFTGSINP